VFHFAIFNFDLAHAKISTPFAEKIAESLARAFRAL